MSYRLKPGRPVDKAVRKAATGQIDKAIAELTSDEADRHEAVHDVRKRLKKLRGLLRLVKPSAPDFFEEENARYRDLARPLSAVRDRTALIEALDGLRGRHADEAEEMSFTPLREALVAQRDAAAGREDLTAKGLAPTVKALHQGREQLRTLDFETGAKGGSDALRKGLKANFAAARAAMDRARAEEGDDDFHELRKRMKYLFMHLKLLEADWPEGIRPLRRMAERIAEDLGRDHDYTVLRAEIAEPGPALAGIAGLPGVVALLDRHRQELRARSLRLAERLLCERPADFSRRMVRLHRVAAREAQAA